jgi:hypothetical protein
MKITKSNLKNAIKNILAESSGLSTQMEMDIESQVRKSQRTPGGLFLEVPNDPQIIQGTRNFLSDRFGMDIKNIVEDPDGEYYIFYQPNLKESKEIKAKITKRRLRLIIRESVKGSWREKEPYSGYLEEQCLDFIENGNNYSGWLDWSNKYIDDEEASDMWDRVRRENPHRRSG